MIQLTLSPTNQGVAVITDTSDSRVRKFLWLTDEEKALVRMWISRAESLTAEK